MVWWMVAASMALAQDEPDRQRLLSVSVAPVTTAGEIDVAVRLVHPDEAVRVYLSTVGVGEGPCLGSASTTCLGLLQPVALGPAVADRSGVARRSDVVNLPPGTPEVWVQVVMEDLHGQDWVSAVAHRVVHDPAHVLDGDLVIVDGADLQSGADWHAVRGDLVVEGTDLEEVELRALTEVGGEVRVWENDALEQLGLPELQHVGEELSLYDAPALPDLSLPSLQTVGGTLSLNRLEALQGAELPALHTAGGLYLFHDPVLSQLSLDALEEVAGAVEVWELYELASLSLPALLRVQGRVDLFELDALQSLSAPQAEELGGLELHHLDALGDAGDWPSLRVVAGGLVLKYDDALSDVLGLGALERVGWLTARSLPSLSALSLPSLVESGGEVLVDDTGAGEVGLLALQLAGAVTLRDNVVLADPGLESVQVSGPVRVVGNPALSTCDVEGWAIELGFEDVACGDNLDDGCDQLCQEAP